MPLQLSAEDANTLAALPEVVRVIVTRDLESQQHARHLAEINDAAREHAAASFAAHPIARQIAALNERHARAAPPGAGPPAGAGRPQPAPQPQPQPPAPAAQPLAMRTIAQHNQVIESRDVAEAIARAQQAERPTPFPLNRSM